MNKPLLLFIVVAFSTTLGCSKSKAQPMDKVENFYNLSARTINGDILEFSELKGKRVLIVNTASQCGFTPQYKSLQKLWEESDQEEFVIIGFPCNDFGYQESGSLKEIEAFCSDRKSVV